MRKLVLAGLVLASSLGTGSAMAADMPVKAPLYKAPPPVEVYSWTGFYVGGNVGGLWEHDSGNTHWVSVNAPAIVTNILQSQSFNPSSVIGGIHAGFNWQASPWLVLGVEGDWEWTGPSSTFCRTTDIGPACTDTGRGFLTFNEKTRWLASARGRLGIVWDRVMLYGTGGAAWGRVNTSINANCLVAGCGFSLIQLNTTASFNDTKTGWVAGVGIEAMLTANWLVRAEYLHYDLGTFTDTLNLVGTVGAQTATWSRRFTYDTARVGLSYKFGGPVVARY